MNGRGNHYKDVDVPASSQTSRIIDVILCERYLVRRVMHSSNILCSNNLKENPHSILLACIFLFLKYILCVCILYTN